MVNDVAQRESFLLTNQFERNGYEVLQVAAGKTPSTTGPAAVEIVVSPGGWSTCVSVNGRRVF